MRILRRYMFRSIVAMSGLALAVLVALGAFIEFVDELSDVGMGDYDMAQAALFTLLEIPTDAFVMLPMAVLIGSLLGLGGLAAQSELIAIRASGVSTFRLAAAVMSTGAAIGLFALVLGSYVAPPLDEYALQFRAVLKHGPESIVTGEAVWIRDGQTILQVGRMKSGSRFGGVYVFKLEPSGELGGVGRADSAGFDDDNQWILDNYAETQFAGDGVLTRRARRSTQANNLSPDVLGLTVVRAESLGALDLYRYVQYLRRNGLDALAYTVAFWQRIANSVAVMFMCVLALPFAFGRLRTSGAGARMVVGILIGLAYFLASRGLADGGEIYNLNAVLIAWLPTLVLATVTVIAVARVR